jgi:hypothetical protein
MTPATDDGYDANDLTEHEYQLLGAIAFNLTDPGELTEAISLLSLPGLRRLISQCDQLIARQERIKIAALYRLQELEV